MPTADRPPSQPPKPMPVTIPSPSEVAKRPSDTGLLNRAATAMAGKPDRHPSGCLCFSIDLGPAGDSEVDALKAKLGDKWSLEVQASNRRRAVIIENNEAKIAAWKQAQAEEQERSTGVKRKVNELLAAVNGMRADAQNLQQETRALLKRVSAEQ